MDTDIVSRAELQALPAPEMTETFKPIPHIELVDTLERGLHQNQIRIEEERFALHRDGSVLFGVLQLAYGETPDVRAALGLRTAKSKTMSIQLCAGLSVLVLRQPRLPRRHDRAQTKAHLGLNLKVELAGAVLRFQDHIAKAMIHDAFVRGLIPVRFLPEVSHAYFEPDVPEFAPRNAWSLHNAFTGAAKEMPITTRLPAIQALGKFFGMSEKEAVAPLLPAARTEPER